MQVTVGLKWVDGSGGCVSLVYRELDFESVPRSGEWISLTGSRLDPKWVEVKRVLYMGSRPAILCGPLFTDTSKQLPKWLRLSPKEFNKLVTSGSYGWSERGVDYLDNELRFLI